MPCQNAFYVWKRNVKTQQDHYVSELEFGILGVVKTSLS